MTTQQQSAEPVPFNAPGKAHVEAMLGSAAPPAVQAEPVAIGHDGKPWPHTIDAKAWADEFCKRNTATDNGTMIGWFANAIEFARAHDAAPPAVQGKTQGYTISRDEEWNLVVTEGTYEDDEAVRLLIRALGYVGADRELRKKITAYLAKVGK